MRCGRLRSETCEGRNARPVGNGLESQCEEPDPETRVGLDPSPARPTGRGFRCRAVLFRARASGARVVPRRGVTANGAEFQLAVTIRIDRMSDFRIGIADKG